jgi:hypothetical protein
VSLTASPIELQRRNLKRSFIYKPKFLEYRPVIVKNTETRVNRRHEPYGEEGIFEPPSKGDAGLKLLILAQVICLVSMVFDPPLNFDELTERCLLNYL